jgi:hypothetical protein
MVYVVQNYLIETSSFWRAHLSRSTLPHPPEDGDRSSFRNAVVFCKTSTFQTMDRVQKKSNGPILWHVDPLLRNKREISDYAAAAAN